MSEHKTPLVSIIIISYRNFSHIYEAIDSALMQDYSRIELIIADDGSEEFPEQEIKTYIDKHKRDNIEDILVYSNEKNLGTVKNLNTAHHKAKGEYILPIACDDCLYEPETTSMIVRRMEETGCGLLAASRLVMNADGKCRYYLPHLIHRKRLMKLTREKQYRMLVSGMFYAMFSGSSLAFRTSSFWNAGGYDEKYILWEDGPFMEKFLRTQRIEPAFDIVMIRYRLGGVSTGGGNPILEEDLKVYNQTDRICQLDKIGSFYQALTGYNIAGKKDIIGVNPLIPMYKLWYKAGFMIAEWLDRVKLAGKTK